MTPAQGQKGSVLERSMPVLYFALAILLVVLVLPSALRPPRTPATNSAELSPDEPPNDQQDSLVSSFNRGMTGTAGAGDAALGAGEGPGVGPGGGPGGGGVGAITPPSKACPHGFGVPPRQIESVYAAPCAGAFTGNNGGSTWKGVSPTEIRIGVRSTASKSGDNNVPGDCDQNGPVDSMDPDKMTKADYTWWVFERYFNANFQFYGRQLRIYCIEPDGNSTTQELAEAAQADDEYHIFGTPYQLWIGACNEFARRHIISFCEQMPASHYASHAPYIWGAWPSVTETAQWTAEYWCKALVGKTASFAGDPVTQRNVRKFAVISMQDLGYDADVAELQNAMKRQCNTDVEVLWTGNADPQRISSAMVKARSDGVTTIAPFLIFYDVLQAGSTAEAQGYVPEWWVTDFEGLTRNFIGQLANQTEWAHAFGVTGAEPERPNNTSECFRAFHAMDPDHDPVSFLCTIMWRNLVLFVSGLQMAGPHLTPTTFQQGWFQLGMRYYSHPSWAVGGGFAPGTYTYPHDTTLVWWNPSAPDPSNLNSVGAYQYLYNARRFCAGQVPAIDSLSHMFKDGVSTPLDYGNYETSPPQRSCPSS